MILHLAWRNIWRNKRRSLIILASVITGLGATVFTDNLMRGFVRQSFENQLGASTGHIQVHAPDFRNNPIVDNYLPDVRPVLDAIGTQSEVTAFTRRAMANGIVSTARNSTGARVIGIHPDEESRVTTLATIVTEGTYLTGAHREALLSEALAKTLDVRVGEKVVAMTANKEGSVGSELFTVVGLYSSTNAAFDKVNLFVPLEDVQRMLGIGDRIAEIAIVLDNSDEAADVAARIQAEAGPAFEVLGYRDLIPAAVMMLEMTEQSMAIFYAIIGLAMLFGIANTMLMSVFERIHEFGVLKSIGLKDRSLFGLVITEAALLGLLGIIGGTALGMAATLPFFHTGVDFSWFAEGLKSWGYAAVIFPMVDPVGILEGLIVIEIIAIGAAIFPALRAMRLLPIDAMRHV